MGEQTITKMRHPVDYGMRLHKRRAWFDDSDETDAAPGNSGEDQATPGNQAGTGTTPVTSGQDTPADNEQDAYPWLGERLDRARQSAIKELLKALGVSDADALKQQLQELTTIKQERMSEQEKLQAALEKAQQKAEEAERRAGELAAQAIRDRATAAIREAAAKANAQFPEDVVTWAVSNDVDFADLLDDGGKVKADAVQALIDQARKERPTWFGGSTPGSPSNAGGRTPEPDKKARQEASENVRQMIRNTF